MSATMRHTILPNGNLKLTANNAARSDLADTLRAHGHNRAWCDVLEHFQPNADLFDVPPEAIGALTDSPILSDDLVRDDQGDITGVGRVWWYPGYAMRDPCEELARTGRTIFEASK